MYPAGVRQGERIVTPDASLPPAEACMGRGCMNPAEYEVRGLVPGLAVTNHPVRLCRGCIGAGHVDFFKWVDSQVDTLDTLLSSEERAALHADLSEMARTRRAAAASAADWPMP